MNSIEPKKALSKSSIGGAVGIIAFVLACFAADGLLELLSDVPYVGRVAAFLQYLRETVF